MRLFDSEIKISDKFGTDFVISLIEILKRHFTVELIQENQVEPDLIFMHYIINNQKISFLTEGMQGTSLIGKMKAIEPILAVIRKNLEPPNTTTSR